MAVIIGIVIVVIVAVLVLLFTTGFFDTLNKGLTTFTPEQVDLKVLACKTWTGADAKASFCKYEEFEKNTYMNCQFSQVADRLKAEGIEVEQFYCRGEPSAPDPEKQFCEDAKGKKPGSVSFSDGMTINGQTCCVNLKVCKETTPASTG